MAEPLLILTTAPDEESAREIAGELIRERLAACVTLLEGGRSIYLWQGSLEEQREVQLLIKSRAECYPQLEETIGRLHPYELPEIIATPIVGGERGYLAWIEQQTGTTT